MNYAFPPELSRPAPLLPDPHGIFSWTNAATIRFDGTNWIPIVTLDTSLPPAIGLRKSYVTFDDGWGMMEMLLECSDNSPRAPMLMTYSLQAFQRITRWTDRGTTIKAITDD